MFTLTTPLFEILVRVLLIYLGLLLVVRLSGKREVGELSPMELLTMLLLSETVSPALTDQDTSVSAGLFAAVVLVGVSVAIGRATVRWKGFRRLVEGQSVVVVRSGKVRRTALRREGLSMEELAAELRKKGIDDVRKVQLATIETDGRMSVISRAGSDAAPDEGGHAA